MRGCVGLLEKVLRVLRTVSLLEMMALVLQARF